MKQYAAMNAIKNLVDSRYHRLIGKSQLADNCKKFFFISLYGRLKNLPSLFTANLNDNDSPKPTTKHILTSEKILNAPMMSNENNESRNDKVNIERKSQSNEMQ